jgi:hypothetical protein
MDRHRMDRIGGDRIWERAVAAAVSMEVKSSAKTFADVEMAAGFGKGRSIDRTRVLVRRRWN